MKKVKSIQAGLIAAVLLASVSTSASASGSYKWYDGFLRTEEQQRTHLEHWHPWTGPMEYFWNCTIGGYCEGSKWR